MIVTVTMNPAIDKTVEIERLVRGGLNRIRSMEYDAGGKGINVSKTISALGGKSIATGFLAGSSGRTIEQVLKEKQISCDFVWTAGDTRTNTKIFEADGSLTELNEPGAAVNEENLAELLQKLKGYAGEDTLFVLSGSVPAGTPKDIYARIIRLVRREGAKILLDADGGLLREAMAEKPDILKPNRAELESYLQFSGKAAEKPLSQEILWQAAEKIARQTGARLAVSMGGDGALFLFDDYRVQCPALPVKAHSTVGAGDAMAAALALAWEEQLDEKETVRLCMAVSAGAVTTVGTKPPAKELVEQLKKQVEFSERK